MSWCNVVIVMNIDSHKELPEPCSHCEHLGRSCKRDKSGSLEPKKKENGMTIDT